MRFGGGGTSAEGAMVGAPPVSGRRSGRMRPRSRVQRQTGHAEFRETLLSAARQAAELGDTDRLAAAALANSQGFYSAFGIIDRDTVDILELALHRVPRDHPSRPLLLATLCSELTFTSTLQRRQDLAREHARLGRLELAHELLDKFAASGFEPMPEPNGWLFTMIHYSDVAIACDDHHAAAALYERLVPYADQLPTKGAVPYPPVGHYLGKLATLLRRYEQADHHFTPAAAFAERAGAAYMATEIDLAWGQMFLQRRQAGDEQRARARLDSARSPPPPAATPTSNDAPPKPCNGSADHHRRAPPCRSITRSPPGSTRWRSAPPDRSIRLADKRNSVA